MGKFFGMVVMGLPALQEVGLQQENTCIVQGFGLWRGLASRKGHLKSQIITILDAM